MCITCHISDDFHRPSHLPHFSFHIRYLFSRIFPFSTTTTSWVRTHKLESQESSTSLRTAECGSPSHQHWVKSVHYPLFFSWILGETMHLPTYDWLNKGCATGTSDNSASVVLTTTTWGPFDKTNSIEPAWVAGHRVRRTRGELTRLRFEPHNWPLFRFSIRKM